MSTVQDQPWAVDWDAAKPVMEDRAAVGWLASIALTFRKEFGVAGGFFVSEFGQWLKRGSERRRGGVCEGSNDDDG